MGYQVNKGVGQPLDFFGLKSQYIIYFLIGIVLAFVLFFSLQFWNKVAAFVIAISIAGVTYFGIHWANKKFGIHGVSFSMARKMLPSRVSPRRIRRFVQIKSSTKS